MIYFGTSCVRVSEAASLSLSLIYNHGPHTDKVEVVNRLDRAHAFNTIKNYGVHYDKLWIFDKIHHEINQFCSAHSLQEVYIDKFDRLDESLAKALQADCTKYDTGIEVIAIRVTKPRIPEGVERNYQLVEEQKTRLLVATQEQLVATKQAETQRVQAKIHAEREAEVALINARREAQVETINAEKAANVSRIHQSKLTEEATANSQRSLIENEAHVKKERALAEATSFKILQEAEANKHLLTPAYLQKLLYESIASNTKIFFGSNIPQIFLDWADRDGQAADLSKIVRLPVDNKKAN